jgi:uncharacterized protein YcfL
MRHALYQQLICMLMLGGCASHSPWNNRCEQQFVVVQLPNSYPYYTLSEEALERVCGIRREPDPWQQFLNMKRK